MFGRISIARSENPNLKDKAGREGLLDNRAAKLFREIVIKILLDVADRYLGRKSDIRQIAIADIKAEKKQKKKLLLIGKKITKKRAKKNKKNR